MSQSSQPLVNIPDNYFAALDIGSNSFHFVYARFKDHHLQILHREKYAVQLASGLDAKKNLSDEAIDQAIQVLAQLATTTKNLSADHFRAVATFTLRQAKNAPVFLAKAKRVFPFDIDIISGHEEARLIYQGVAHNLAGEQPRLVIDIGGGSTECIIGTGAQILTLASVSMGCVSFRQQFFNDGKITAKRFKQAIMAAKLELDSIVSRFKKYSWQKVIGTSGTIKTIFNILNQQQDEILHQITLNDLHHLKTQLIHFGDAKHINYADMKEKRRYVLASGLSILIALFEVLELQALDYCEYSLRDGVLAEMLEVDDFGDVRQRTITSLQERFSVDLQQVSAVNDLAMHIFQTVKAPWQLTLAIYQKLLCWACQIHEIGVDINPSGYHKHGQYIIENTDLAGFSQEQQMVLAWLIGNQRKKIQPINSNNLNLFDNIKLNQILLIIRLAVLLQRQRQLTQLPQLKVSVYQQQLQISFPDNWLAQRELLAKELAIEAKVAKKLGIHICY